MISVKERFNKIFRIQRMGSAEYQLLQAGIDSYWKDIDLDQFIIPNPEVLHCEKPGKVISAVYRLFGAKKKREKVIYWYGWEKDCKQELIFYLLNKKDFIYRIVMFDDVYDSSYICVWENGKRAEYDIHTR